MQHRLARLALGGWALIVGTLTWKCDGNVLENKQIKEGQSPFLKRKEKGEKMCFVIAILSCILAPGISSC